MEMTIQKKQEMGNIVVNWFSREIFCIIKENKSKHFFKNAVVELDIGYQLKKFFCLR